MFVEVDKEEAGPGKHDYLTLKGGNSKSQPGSFGIDMF